jgi:hypothetical protein
MPRSLVYPQTQMYSCYTHEASALSQNKVVTSQRETENNEARSRPVVMREPVFC